MSSLSLMMLMLVAVLTSTACMPPQDGSSEPPLGCTFINGSDAIGINPGDNGVNLGDMNCNSCSCDVNGLAACGPCPGADASGGDDTSDDGAPDASGDGAPDASGDGAPDASGEDDNAPNAPGEGATNAPDDGAPNAPDDGAPNANSNDASGSDAAPDAPEEPATCLAPGGQVITVGVPAPLTSNPNVTCKCEGNSTNATCVDPTCVDSTSPTQQCRAWAQLGYCTKNKNWMNKNCRNSCQVCLYGACENKAGIDCSLRNIGDCLKPSTHPNLIIDCPKYCNACTKKG